MRHAAITEAEPPITEEIVDLMLNVLSDGFDHPELWVAVPGLMENHPDLAAVLQRRFTDSDSRSRLGINLLLALVGTMLGHGRAMIEALRSVAPDGSQSPLVQGVLFHIEGVLDPANPKYQLTGKLCRAPFEPFDVPESSAA